ncbi:MAG: homoserine dehydrogenase [Chloroflexi bacterium]|nr:homoserine dehydrogenase [Chloroflexota bacterium]
MSEGREVPLIVLGVGGVGRSFLEQIVRRRSYHEKRYDVRFKIVALADSTGAAVSPAGLTDEEIQQAIEAKAQGGRLSDLPFGYYQNDVRSIVDLEATQDTVVVDMTASTETMSALQLAMERRSYIVLANKLPLTAPISRAWALYEYPRLRYETTVGAALPVITTAKRLAASGESIQRIMGVLSGTLGYLMTAVEDGVAFSKAVLKAKELGYTEPDPREDLSGRDVARKGLILARTLGWRLEMEDVQVQSLYPEEWDTWPLEDVMAELIALDDDFFAWVDAARARHEALRYVAKLEDGRVEVGIQFVPLDSPLGRLRGTDNLVEFYTEYYDPQPLVLAGRGAGVHSTAAGVLSDILELVLYPWLP